jgi:hypothetical protein
LLYGPAFGCDLTWPISSCKKLGSLARTYGANTGPVPETIAKRDSDAKGSIAVLEKHLQAEKIKLPPR